ncbi:Receptor-type guanylate cyclase Gyc76C [Amphibalanus amphitrite]|uniref:Guanylate cyclase n=1 Tax=Amphibalanus amphitrite TaxID=1232801 RepID=A0A6A4WQ65_AMPAM|nr:Receptor-type guanylate cyclase Gyc76C [Amphibalanus amphitrite]
MSTSKVTKSAVALLKHYKWNKFSIITTESSTISKIADSLKKLAISEGMTINHKVVIPDYDRCCKERSACCDLQMLANVIKETKDGTRVYVFLGTSESLQNMLTTMSMFNLLDGTYMVIYIDLDFVVTKSNSFKYMWPADKMWELAHYSDYECQASDVSPLRSLLVVMATPPRGHDAFSRLVRTYNERPPFDITSPGWWPFKKVREAARRRRDVAFGGETRRAGGETRRSHVGVYAAYLYDSVMMYARALNRTISDNPGVPLRQILTNGSDIVMRIRNQTFQSVMGSVIKMDDNGDSEGNFTVLALQSGCGLHIRYENSHQFALSCDDCMAQVGQFFLTNSTLPEFKIDTGKSIQWLGGLPPIDEPHCGFDGTKCYTPDDSRQTVATVLGSVLLAAILVMLYVYRMWKEEQEILGLLWKIAPEALDTGPPPLSDSKQSITSIASFESKCFGQIFTMTGRYDNNTVRVQTLNFSRKADISRRMMKEMRTMWELRHQNVNPFLGAVVEPTCIRIVTEYCTRGSLPDILEGGELTLEYMFIAELIRDLVKGMLYLHNSALLVHGNLKSSNCVVTSRWVLKVTDFGMRDLRAAADLDSQSNYQYYKSQLWKSPEQLRAPQTPCSRADDVYAFGIILHEIMCRDGPFGGVDGPPSFEPKQIVGLVKQVPAPGQEPFRPPLNCLHPPPDMPPESERLVVDCMQQCWQESEASRPGFLEIKKLLQPLRAGLSTNLVNQMMEKMEKYANNLEDLVRERTQLLNEEKQKTEALLYRMLPESVASDLTRGIPVQPETFDSVTIYFSDIVGFTRISAESKPLQVVELLNDLYTVFDRIIRSYDVYKVETIGDAYMVVSGVPKPNGIQHAGEIASMALSLLDAIRQHKIQHRPGEQLKLRIGIHTGQVVAGVVGLTMPRYCLFGDTVNTASRIESTGEPLRIHISDQCQRTLTQLGGYQTVPRGPVHMKGKGLVETHWLVGSDHKRPPPLDQPAQAPLFSRAATVRRHEPSHAAASRLSLASLRTRGSAASREPSRPASRAESPPRRRLAVPRLCQRPASLPAVRESRSLDNFPRALRLPARPVARRRDSRSVADCRELLAREQETGAGGGGESAEPMLSCRLLRSRLEEQLEPAGAERESEGEDGRPEPAELSPPPEPEEHDHGEQERGPERADELTEVAAPPLADAPPAWDCIKDWFRRFFSRHRLEPSIPLNGKLKHNGYSLHSSHDTVV